MMSANRHKAQLAQRAINCVVVVVVVVLLLGGGFVNQRTCSAYFGVERRKTVHKERFSTKSNH